MSIEEAEAEIVSDFELFESWNEKYQYIIELGQQLPAIAPEYKSETYMVKGCQSSVWMHVSENKGNICFEADSDSVFVKGLLKLLVMVLDNRNPDEIINARLDFIEKIGLKQHLAQTRANGLAAMIKQMKLYALGMKGSKA